MSDNGTYGYAIDSVEKAARTLMMLRDRPSIRAADVAVELNVARSTAHRMVSTLAQTGLLRRNTPEKTYSAGPALIDLSRSVSGSIDVRAAVGPALSSLAERTGETAQFLVRERDEVVFVDAAEGTRIIRAASRVGTRLPAHVTAAGKCLLAELPRAEVEPLYTSTRHWPDGTAHAIRGREELLRELDEVTEKGWALNRSESEPDLFGLAMAVHDAAGTAIGAITISGPHARMVAEQSSILTELQREIVLLERGAASRTIS